MKLKNFIERLDKLAEKCGDKMEVVMADNIKIVNPIFRKNYQGCARVIITDGK